jgi:hypothetical protein
MKRIEDLESGDTFELDGNFYVLSRDYKKNGDRNCVCLETGNSKWIDSEQFVTHNPIYYLDQDNNIVALKPMEKSSDV